MWSAKINASTAKYEAPDEVDPVVTLDRDDESDRCIQCALGEGDREGDDFCANLEDRDKETEVLGGALLMLDIGADFPLGPTTMLFHFRTFWLPILPGRL